MQGSIPPKSDNRAIGGELSFVDAPPDKTFFDLLLLPSTVLDFRFPFTFVLSSATPSEGVADVDEFKFNLFRR